MTARLGEVLFWASVILAGLFFYVVFGEWGAPKDEPTFYIAGGIIVLIGWALRYILAGRKP
jgi:hypothetical protein